jgi:uncharacterized repeat protein (TIGR03803 family)
MRLFKLFAMLCAVSAYLGTAAQAQTFTTLYSFCPQGGCSGGLAPNGALVQATNGDLYGNSPEGGAQNLGSVFKITPGGTLTTLHSFCAQSGCPDGWDPVYSLVLSTNGDLYGFTASGGADAAGTFFKITPSGTLSTLQSFCDEAGCLLGEYLNPLVRATNGDFYFTTQAGGIANSGTVSKFNSAGTLTTLYSFTCSGSDECSNGRTPFAGLTQATNGDLYGTTQDGGNGDPGSGTIFKITMGGTLTSLYSFCAQSGCPDGADPIAAPVQASNGDLYGTTMYGGNGSPGSGTVFKLTTKGEVSTLYKFCAQSGCPDGTGSGYPLIQATDGNLYGTNTSGGAHSHGTIFKITPGGVLTTLYSFCAQSGCTDGEIPNASLVQHTNGILYGTTAYGGANGAGTIFTLSLGLAPFVEALPASGKAGAGVKILGTNLKGATAVTFNGTAATFTVVSASEITTTVPAGATTGYVEVTTPSSGTLQSNVVFTVKSTPSTLTSVPPAPGTQRVE